MCCTGRHRVGCCSGLVLWDFVRIGCAVIGGLLAVRIGRAAWFGLVAGFALTTGLDFIVAFLRSCGARLLFRPQRDCAYGDPTDPPA